MTETLSIPNQQASPPPSQQSAPVTTVRVLRDWSFANCEPLDLEALTRASGDVRRRG